MSQIDRMKKMVDALREGVANVMKIPADKQEAALSKNFTEFGEALNIEMSGVQQEAFIDGRLGNLRKFVTGEDKLGKETSFSLVAQIAQALATLDAAVDYACGVMSNDGKTRVLGDAVCQSLEDYVTVGEGVLRQLIGAGDIDDVDKAAKNAGLEKLTPDEQKALAGKLAKLKQIGKLAKAFPPKKPADGQAPADGGGPGDGGAGGADDNQGNAQMNGDGTAADGTDAGDGDETTLNPLEVIGRLAAAILVQIEAIINDDGSAGGDGTTDATTGAAAATAGAEDTAKVAPKGDLAKQATAAAASTTKVDPNLEALTKSVAALGRQVGELAKRNQSGGGGANALAGAEAEFKASIDKMGADVTALTAVVTQLTKSTPADGGKGAVNTLGKVASKEGDQGGATNEETLKKFATDLAAMPADQRAGELIKLVQSTGGRKI